MDNWLYIVLMFVNVQRVYVFKDSSLTTTSFTELTSPIPTLNMMYRRMGDEKQWSWDKWCLMQRKPGDGKEKQNLFYYDTQIDECRVFVYTGCNGNENQFATRRECEQFCKGFGLVVHAKSLTQEETCSLQPDPGMCLASIERYYFDIALRKCRLFIFGGCGGNSNRFLDEDSCLEKCAPPPPVTGARSAMGVMKAYDFE